MMGLFAQVDPAAATAWVAFIEKVGYPGVAFVAICYGAYRVGLWLSNASHEVAIWAAPLVVEIVKSLGEFVRSTDLRLASLEDKSESLGKGIRDLHRRLDKHNFPLCDEDSDEVEPFNPRKSAIHKRAE